MICPCCYSDNVESVEVDFVTTAENSSGVGTAIECLDCGLRGPVAQEADSFAEECQAIDMWEEMVFLRKDIFQVAMRDFYDLTFFGYVTNWLKKLKEVCHNEYVHV